jgi:hypothetical protein
MSILLEQVLELRFSGTSYGNLRRFDLDKYKERRKSDGTAYGTTILYLRAAPPSIAQGGPKEAGGPVFFTPTFA